MLDFSLSNWKDISWLFVCIDDLLLTVITAEGVKICDH